MAFFSRFAIFLFLLPLLSWPAFSFERSKFKLCSQSGFCRRNRARAFKSPNDGSSSSSSSSSYSSHVLSDPSSFVKESQNRVSFRLKENRENADANVKAPKGDGSLKVILSASPAGELRVDIAEVGVPRHYVSDVLTAKYDIYSPEAAVTPSSWPTLTFHGTPLVDDAHHHRSTYTEVTVSHPPTGGPHSPEGFKVRVYHEPFGIAVHDSQGRESVVLNGRGLLGFEITREKTDGEEGDGHWSETFGGNTDSKPHGPQAVSLDISFSGADALYGLPERAKSFALPPTASEKDEPYRLYNLDVFEYESDHSFGLYGSVPVLMGHSTLGTSAVLWLNSAETWVDIGTHKTEGGDGEKVASLLPKRRIDSFFISESGLLSVLVMPHASPQSVFGTISKLTGPAQLPPLFALGHHQCRWNYNDQADFEGVNKGLDDHDIPTDVIWLDIEHTDGKRYMTWDARKFPDPEKMMNSVFETSGRKTVTIVDPHIKRDSKYPIHAEAERNGYYVKKPDGGDFEGHCWPGSSSYVDYTRPEVRSWWADLFSKYPHATRHLYTWVDMQEPSVFGSPLGAPEVTMPKDLLHGGMRSLAAEPFGATPSAIGLVESVPGKTEHRDVHNMYGQYCQRAAHDGNLALRSGNERPFVLARAFFAGSQRYGAVWTGDNTAEWSHLKASVPMLLSLSMSGITFSGADVGGFFGNPSTELLVRWYQAAAYQPFYRSHAHIDTARREPWLFGEPTTGLIREAIGARYALMPYLYTLFHEATSHAAPVMRPLWFEFPMDRETFTIDDSFLLGGCVLVKPVVKEGAETSEVYLPTNPRPFRASWYDAETLDVYEPGHHVVSSPLRKTPVFVRGGCIIPRRERRRRSTHSMAGDPVTLKVVLDSNGISKGSMYIDDGSTHAYRDGNYALMGFRMTGKGVLKAQRIAGNGFPPAPNHVRGRDVERIVIVGWGDRPVPKSVKASVGGHPATEVEFEVGSTDGTLIFKRPGVKVDEAWEITIEN